MRQFFIVNPAAFRCPSAIEDSIRAKFPSATVKLTDAPGHAYGLALEAREELGAEPGVIVACGGDGTFREIATAVGGDVTLGLVPLGTVNMVARQAGIPIDLEQALSVVQQGQISNVYAGRCVCENMDTLFFIGVSAGPDADAVHGVGQTGKRLFGRYIYLIHFLRRMTRAVPANIPFDDGRHSGRCGQLYVLKMPEYAGPYRFSATLSLFEQGLEMTVLPGRRSALLRFLWRVFRGKVSQATWNPFAPVDRITIHPPGGRFQLDGDAFNAPQVVLEATNVPLHLIVGLREEGE